MPLSSLNLSAIKRLLSRSSLVLLCLLSTSCQLPYYWQAASGHLSLMQQRKPLAQAATDPRLTDTQKQNALLIPEILKFAQTHLHLKTNNLYQQYVYLKQPPVVTNVFVAPQLDITPLQWCYPFAGCVPYRGYFKADRANTFARHYKNQGFDVYISGASAYSTLGWFDDPVLSTFLSLPEPDLVSLLFHELAHATLYIKGNSVFNESFAKTIEQYGLERWHDYRNRQAQPNTPKQAVYPAFYIRQNINRLFVEKLQALKHQLKTLYASDSKDSEKINQKAKLLQQFRHDFEQQTKNKTANHHYQISGEPNNARLSLLGTYYDLVPELSALLKQLDKNLPAFYRTCKIRYAKPRLTE